MALSVKFYIESRTKGDDNKLLPIFLYIRHNGRTLKVFTERKCTIKGWDVTRCRANSRKFSASIELNGFLGTLEEEASNLYNYNSRSSVPTTKEHLQKLIQKLSGRQTEDQNLQKFAESFLQKSSLAPNTKKSYTNTLNLIDEFTTSKHRKVIDFNDVDLNFYDDFTNWLWNDKKQNDNSVGKHIKNIKSLMAQAFERDLHNNLQFKKKMFHVFKHPSETIYLNEEELDRIQNIDLSADSTLEQVRDAFIIASWTGVAFAELSRITPDKFIVEDGIQLLKIEREKTREIVKIPISPKVRPILEKYNYRMKVLTNQKMNEYLKEIGAHELAKLDQDIELSEVKAGKRTREMKKKHELITTHTARRSFASNLYLQGIPASSIMAITGHRTEKAFLTYIKLSKMDKIRQIDSHFKKVHSAKLKTA